jgi:Domain of unknown function (DUF4160)
VGKLFQIGNVIVRIYPNDHLPPHFHVVAPDFDAMIAIETLEAIASNIPAKHRDAVLGWASENRPIIIAEWNKLQPRFKI